MNYLKNILYKIVFRAGIIIGYILGLLGIDLNKN